MFINEIYSKRPMRNYPTKKIVYNQFDEIRFIDLADFSDYKTSNNKGFRYIFVINDNLSKYTWCTPLKNKCGESTTKDFSNSLTSSKRSPVKLESDRGAELYNSNFHKIFKK